MGKHGKPKGSDIPPKALVGLLVLLAILFRKRPDVILLKAEELRGPEFTKVERLNTLGWAFSQVRIRVLENNVEGLEPIGWVCEDRWQKATCTPACGFG